MMSICLRMYLYLLDNSEGEAESFIEYFYIATIPVNDAPVIESYTGPMALEEDGSFLLIILLFLIQTTAQ